MNVHFKLKMVWLFFHLLNKTGKHKKWFQGLSRSADV